MEGDQMPMFSPNTWSVPLPRSRCDFALLGKIYQNGQILFEQNKSSEWIRGIRQGLYNMSTASSQFVSASIASDDPSMVRVYEAKYFHCFNPRWATYDLSSGHVVDNNEESLRLEDNIICQHYVTRDDVEMKLKELNWHHSYLIAWRDITNATNERTAIFALLPRAGLGNNAGLLIPREDLHPSDILVLLANLNSLVFDYATRQKVGGTHLNGFILEQLPVLERGKIDRDDIDFLSERAGRLSFNSADLEDAALEFGLRPQATLASERCVLKAEIDAYIARLYGLTHDELRYILDPSDVMGPDYPSETFRVLKNSEIRQFGEYRTQRLVLEAWDRLFGP